MLSSQVVYSIQYSLSTPILIHFGASQITMSITWSFAPSTGLFVHPIVGYYSYRSQSRFGRRRPFLVAGGLGLLTNG
jgi:solute carrier family 45 protein 1/2/4